MNFKALFFIVAAIGTIFLILILRDNKPPSEYMKVLRTLEQKYVEYYEPVIMRREDDRGCREEIKVGLQCDREIFLELEGSKFVDTISDRLKSDDWYLLHSDKFYGTPSYKYSKQINGLVYCARIFDTTDRNSHLYFYYDGENKYESGAVCVK